MESLEQMISAIDTDAALVTVAERHRRQVQRRGRGRVLLGAVAVALVIGMTWSVVQANQGTRSGEVIVGPNGSSPALATVGVDGSGGEPDRLERRTPRTVNTVAGDGLSITVTADDDDVAVGAAVKMDVTLRNEGTATFSGSFGAPVECNHAIGFAVRMVDQSGGVISIGNLNHGDNDWFATREEIVATAARNIGGTTAQQPTTRDGAGSRGSQTSGVVVPGVLGRPLALRSTCDAEPTVEDLLPGQSITLTGTWTVWIGEGDVPPAGTFQIDTHVSVFGCTGCTELPPNPSRTDCKTCSALSVGGVSVPIRVDPSTRTAPPSATQLTQALEDADVQQILRRIIPRSGVGMPQVFGGWLLQIDHRWLQRIQGEDGAVDIWFDTAGSTIAVQHKTGSDPVEPPADASSPTTIEPLGQVPPATRVTDDNARFHVTFTPDGHIQEPGVGSVTPDGRPTYTVAMPSTALGTGPISSANREAAHVSVNALVNVPGTAQQVIDDIAQRQGSSRETIDGRPVVRYGDGEETVTFAWVDGNDVTVFVSGTRVAEAVLNQVVAAMEAGE